MALTKIFLESGVNIPPDEPKEVLKYTNFYTLGTLTRMGFQKEDKKWIRKITIAPAPSGIPPPAPTVLTSSPPMSPLSHFSSPPPGPYQTYQDPHPFMSYFDNTQAIIASLSESMTSQF